MKITSTEDSLEKIEADALAVVLFQGEKPQGEIENLDNLIATAISQTIKLGDFKGKLYEVTSVYTHGKTAAARVLLVGAGKKADFDQRLQRNVAGAAARRAIKLGAKKLAFDLGEVSPQLAIEGVGLANFNPGIYKTKKDDNGEISELILIGRVKEQEIKAGNILIESSNWVRKLISEPANLMTPAKMVEEAKKLAKEYKFGIEVINEATAKRKGMGAFAGIAQGSEEPSYMVVLRYNAGSKETLGVVGKGITFDSGGISLKPSDKMHEMKMDMSGAAASFGFMKIVGELRPKTSVVMVTPLTENLPGGRALKPGDVVKSLSGKTIEVLNTDAEGRVVLSDALTYAQKLGATKIVDLATLTGAVQIALGSEAAGILGNKSEWVKAVISAGHRVGERLWELPIYPEHNELLRSDIADMANIPPSRGAGVIAGAVFLKEFIEPKNSWVHLDIAATAWLDGEKPFLAKGPTAFGVATLVELLKDIKD